MKKFLKPLLLLTICLSLILLLLSCGNDANADSCNHRDANDDSVCDICAESYTDGVDVETHTHSFELENSDGKFLKSKATCNSPATYYFSCECGEYGDETFDFGDVAEHTFVDGVCDVCGAVGTPGLVYTLEGDSYTVTGAPEGSLRVVIPSAYDNIPVTKVADAAFSNSPCLLSVELGSNIAEVSATAFDGCIKLFEIINKSDVYLSRCPNTVIKNDAEPSRIIKSGDFWFYMNSDIDLSLVHYSGTQIEVALPDYAPIREEFRLLVPEVLQSSDFEGTILIPLIEKFENLAEECCKEENPDYDFHFFDNEEYESYNKYGYIDFYVLVSEYFNDVNGIATKLATKGKITHEEFQKISNLRNDIISLVLTSYIRFAPKEIEERGPVALEGLYEAYPITKEGVAIYVYSGSDKYEVRQNLAKVITTYIPDYDYEIMLAGEARAKWDQNKQPYTVDDLAFVGTTIAPKAN